MLLTLSLGEAIGARRAGGGRRPRSGRAESERPPPPRSPQPAPSSSRPRPSPAAANASLCCLMRDRQARDTRAYLSAEDSLSPDLLPRAIEKGKRAQLCCQRPGSERAARPHRSSRARPQFGPPGQHSVQVAPKLRIGEPEPRRSAGPARPAAGDLRKARGGGPAHAPRAGRAPAGADACTSAAPPPRGRRPWLRRAARACARRSRVPPRPAAGHARCARGAGGPFKAGAAERAPAPPAAPPRREVCARRPAVLCALLGVELAAEGGRARTGRRGTASCAPFRSSRGRLRARGKKEGFGGRAGAHRLPAGRRPPPGPPPAQPRAPTPPRAPRAPLFVVPGAPGLAASPRPAGRGLRFGRAAGGCGWRRAPASARLGGTRARDNAAMWPPPRTGPRGGPAGAAGRARGAQAEAPGCSLPA
ncbi:translation initiation factor IF-2-like [Felis catus]|uniref:translation initiation factor IF-2-like n=1 Tax=Felis catus TaxID=9685 RepID=UPI001D1A274F|nr:translation initiation factor IF-2-like [Felis catus]